MKAILFKMQEGYALSLDGDIDNLFAVSNTKLAEDYGLNVLSIRNCEKMFDLINVEELADKYSEGIIEIHIKRFRNIR